MEYGKTFGGADPELIEGDIFRIIVKLPPERVYEDPERDDNKLRLESRLAAKVDEVWESLWWS